MRFVSRLLAIVFASATVAACMDAPTFVLADENADVSMTADPNEPENDPATAASGETEAVPNDVSAASSSPTPGTSGAAPATTAPKTTTSGGNTQDQSGKPESGNPTSGKPAKPAPEPKDDAKCGKDPCARGEVCCKGGGPARCAPASKGC